MLGFMFRIVHVCPRISLNKARSQLEMRINRPRNQVSLNNLILRNGHLRVAFKLDFTLLALARIGYATRILISVRMGGAYNSNDS